MAMTHEGGTVAGESPGRSEQRKSSGETTGRESDPRLAVFREGSRASSEALSESSASAAEPPANERTAVFRTLPARGAAEAAATAEADVDPGAAQASRAGVGEDPASRAERGGVATASEDEGDASADAADEDGVAESPASPAEAAGAATDAGASGADSADAAEAVGAADAAGGAAAEGEASSVDAAGRAEGGVPGEARAASVPAAGSGVASQAESTSASSAEESGEASPDGDAASSARRSTEASSAAPEPPLSERTAVFRTLPARGASDAVKGASGDTPQDGATSEESGGNDARLRAAVAAWVGKTNEDAEPSAAPADAPGKKASAEAADAEGAEPSASASANANVNVNADAKPKAKSDERPAVDQPTTTFKALRRPAVDQPTTALKLPPVPKPASESELAKKAATPSATPSANESAAASASGSQGSSTFVPLRRDEASAASPRKPQASSAPLPPASLTEAERTKQQPMPPLPPLDLLAELTNTPPPPETPVRTVVRRIKIWTPLVLFLLIVFAVVQMVRPLPDPQLALTADAEVSFDGGKPALPWPGEGQGQIVVSGLGVVGEFGEEKPVPIASVTKTMTAYIIMRDHPFKRGEDGASIPVDALAEKEGGYDQTNDESTLNTIKEGDTISERDALSAIMIPSANNVARLLARWDAGSEKAFVKKMNDTAKELGMTNTTYTDPSGLNATTVSTAADQVKLGQALVKNKAMVDITRQQEWYDPSGKRHSNYNTLMPRNGAIGIKTGSTTKAGGNLLFAAYKDIGGTTQTIVGAVLGQHKPSILETVNRVSEEVLVATREALEAKTVVKKGDVVGHVDDGLGGRTPVVATKDMTVVGWSSLKVELGITDGGKKLPHTAKAGTVVGSLTAGSGAGTISVPVALQQDLVEPGFGDKLTRIV
ncbi:D-alanyl-D-alanine carboxypeptidase [Streptomyces sp. NPDC015127]|uniref:D-alanyl-D-alanine carboxypeptidase n=1 Tax=Streptomyces sp. NPDC015127 TaxID=3364939 RepID=UPI0036FF8308